MWQLERVSRGTNAVVNLIEMGYVSAVLQVEIDAIPASGKVNLGPKTVDAVEWLPDRVVQA